VIIGINIGCGRLLAVAAPRVKTTGFILQPILRRRSARREKCHVWRPTSWSRCSRTTSPKPPTDSESPINEHLWRWGRRSPLLRLLKLIARTNEPIRPARQAKMKPCESLATNVSYRPFLGYRAFILDANVGSSSIRPESSFDFIVLQTDPSNARN